MRDYAKVSPKFWCGATGKALRAQGQEALVVGLYLMTSPHANMLGLYYMPITFIAHETGLGIEGASKGLQRAIEAGFCLYDEASEVVWVMEMAKYQIAESLKPNDLRVKGVQNDYAALPSNPFLSPFFDKYAEAFCMAARRESAVSRQAPSKPLRSQEQEQEQEKELQPPQPPRSGGAEPSEISSNKRERKPRISLKTFLDRCQQAGEKAVSAHAPLLEYVEATGLPMEFVQLAWDHFKREHLPPGANQARLQADWRRHFLAYVEKGYYRLWYAKPDGGYELTTVGIQAQRLHAAGGEHAA